MRTYQMGRIIGVVHSIRATDTTESLNSFQDAGTRATDSLKLVGLLTDAQDTDSTSQERASEAVICFASSTEAVQQMYNLDAQSLTPLELVVYPFKFDTVVRLMDGLVVSLDSELDTLRRL